MSANVLTAAHSFLPTRDNGAGLFEQVSLRLTQGITARRDRSHLADLDERLLADIGIATDEVPLVRAGVQFTPRAWAERRGR